MVNDNPIIGELSDKWQTDINCDVNLMSLGLSREFEGLGTVKNDQKAH